MSKIQENVFRNCVFLTTNKEKKISSKEYFTSAFEFLEKSISNVGLPVADITFLKVNIEQQTSLYQGETNNYICSSCTKDFIYKSIYLSLYLLIPVLIYIILTNSL